MMIKLSILWLAILAPVLSQSKSCKCFPGESCWPTISDWSALNHEVEGRLIRTIPLGSPCHDPTYDAKACTALQGVWFKPITHYQSSSSVMEAFFANASCDPFLPRSSQCVIGTYVQYSVNVSTSVHVVSALNFAKKNNIRFIIRNTGHDYEGKSTGAGALGIWTHHLKDKLILDWNDKHYQGKAIKLGAGIQGFEAVAFATASNLVLVTGVCSTVGITGGYLAGGGHGPLLSKFGLGADQALQYEVIDGRGEYLIVNRTTNSDLYWALSGGGGGTYAVVLSVVVKAYPESITTVTSLTVESAGLSNETYISALVSWVRNLPNLVDSGAMATFLINRTSLLAPTIVAYGKTTDELNTLLQPFYSSLFALNVTYTNYTKTYSSYGESYPTVSTVISDNAYSNHGGTWLTPRASLTNDSARRAYVEGVLEATDLGAIALLGSWNPSKKGDIDNGVFPQWRTTLIGNAFIRPLTTPWNLTSIEVEQHLLTNKILPIFQKLYPDGGAYLNEADYNDPNWKVDFYGSNYAKLREIKAIYDPSEVFYGSTAVGGDEWYETETKQLCRV
ncbi:FAD-linked oxidoreductase ZEB1 [Lachnellula cervina]|uniref:FAD-linked oxidoreductase ZEB1 n=1 Tax=Lachnellula cervina TaxID=1316786 RepID=A0A7D8UU14_9HELO|nr:FAD-linked oxidoreductase ZEB1 [Lachnellula cervina]